MIEVSAGRCLAGSLTVALLLGFSGCGGDPSDLPASARARDEATTSASAAKALDANADARSAADSRREAIARGRALVSRFECARCHEGTGLPTPPRESRCVGCHTDIVEGRVEATPRELADWKSKVRDLSASPSLGSVGRTVSETFVARYLTQPFDLRPHLRETMPRLDITPLEAADVAAYLASRSTPLADLDATPGDASHGRALFEQKKCGSCHAFGGASNVISPGGSNAGAPNASDRTLALAPDLRFTRDRWAQGAIVQWLVDPKSVRADAAMPRIPMSQAEARDLAAFVSTTTLDPMPPLPPLVRLPVLTRAVTYDEVEARVLHKTCWHCHEEPDYARGDGGPGMTGGFGFPARHLNLTTYEGLLAGYVDEKGERRSLFAPSSGDTPVFLAALLARQSEERGTPARDRGMPLGMPALSPEDIQLVESWIAQGHPR